MKSVGKIKDGVLYFPPAVNQARKDFIARHKDDTIMEETLSVPRASKSQSQLGAIWGLALATVVSELDDRGYDTSFILKLPDPTQTTGIAIKPEMLCDYMYQVCPMYNEEGARITLSKSNTKEAAKFFDDCRNFWAAQWQIYVPDPNPNWRDEIAEVASAFVHAKEKGFDDRRQNG
jgi:hypothetical protein